MGKATRWLKGLFGMKKEKEQSNRSGPLFMDKKEKGNGNKSGPLFLDRKEKKQLRKDHQGHMNQTGSWYRSNVDEKHNDYNKKTCFLRSLSHGSSRESVLFISREWWAAVIIQSLFRGYLVCLLDQNLCFLEKFMLTFKDVFFIMCSCLFFSVSTNLCHLLNLIVFII